MRGSIVNYEVVANCDHLARLKFSSQLPLVFTGHGAIMAASGRRDNKKRPVGYARD